MSPKRKRCQDMDDVATNNSLNEEKVMHKKITSESYWSGDILIEVVEVDSFRPIIDHDYCSMPEEIQKAHHCSNNANFVELNIQSCVEIQDEKALFDSVNFNSRGNNFMDLDVQSCIEVQYDQDSQITVSDFETSSFNLLNDENSEEYTFEFDENELFETDFLMQRDDCEHSYCRREQTFSPHINDLDVQSFIELPSFVENSLMNDIDCNSTLERQISHRNSLNSDTTDDSGISSLYSDNSYIMTESVDDLFPIRDKSLDDYLSLIQMENKNVKKISSKKSLKFRNEVLVSKESPIIEDEFEQMRRVTRFLAKNKVKKEVKSIDNVPGKFVWGCFRGSWWPAIIIKAEDAGMFPSPGKIWVAWIGELQISELNEKNVEPFSKSFMSRLEYLAGNISDNGSKKNLKEEACYQTIKLLKKYLSGGALIKPYSTWIKINILPKKNKLDKILFYPYPEAIYNKLKELKKLNSKITKKYLQEQESHKRKREVEEKNQLKKKEKTNEKPDKAIEEGGINVKDQKPGMIVWAKIPGFCLWPCVIMNYEHLNRKQANVAHQWVMWYGDYKYSQVHYRQIYSFSAGMEKMEFKIRKKLDDLFSKGVLQASKDYCEKLGYFTEPWNLDDVIDFFLASEKKFELKNVELQESYEDFYPQIIQKQIRKQINNQPVIGKRKKSIINCGSMKDILNKKSSLEKLCITCFTTEELEEHPFFFASMCKNCMDEFKSKIFAYGSDGKCFYCTLCGGDDSVAMCDSLNCPRVFCTACIECIISPDYYEEILERQPWYCFICESNSSAMKNSIIKVRDDWRKKIISFYRINCNDEILTNFERFDCKKKIRVLSLFDGIGTGLLVLKKLNIDVECYYASEIDQDSMKITFVNHGKKVIQLGDVRNIDEKKVKEIVPIDLLIGGSPCNDLSMANPKRRGLDDPEGTGVLFYDYCRIKKMISKHNKNRHLFWLFENVASMPKKYRNQISDYLGKAPIFLDSAEFSAQHRPRLYWGNLPWGPYQVNDVVLQDVLVKQCNRQALVKKILTVTTKLNSINQTKANLKPVLMDGKKDSLWITELEELFGFPQHYTDVNLLKTRRLQILGKAWSVQTLMAILRPVFFF